jgi:hypothetical protein
MANLVEIFTIERFIISPEKDWTISIRTAPNVTPILNNPTTVNRKIRTLYGVEGTS